VALNRYMVRRNIEASVYRNWTFVRRCSKGAVSGFDICSSRELRSRQLKPAKDDWRNGRHIATKRPVMNPACTRACESLF